GTGSVGNGSLSTDALPFGSIAAIVNERCSARSCWPAASKATSPTNAGVANRAIRWNVISPLPRMPRGETQRRVDLFQHAQVVSRKAKRIRAQSMAGHASRSFDRCESQRPGAHSQLSGRRFSIALLPAAPGFAGIVRIGGAAAAAKSIITLALLQRALGAVPV